MRTKYPPDSVRCGEKAGRCGLGQALPNLAVRRGTRPAGEQRILPAAGQTWRAAEDQRTAVDCRLPEKPASPGAVRRSHNKTGDAMYTVL